MTIIREYKCNFCNGTHFDNSEIYGTHWSGKTLGIVDKDKSENHLCDTCLKAIHAAVGMKK